jgi:hypothetical protein
MVQDEKADAAIREHARASDRPTGRSRASTERCSPDKIRAMVRIGSLAVATWLSLLAPAAAAIPVTWTLYAHESDGAPIVGTLEIDDSPAEWSIELAFDGGATRVRASGSGIAVSPANTPGGQGIYLRGAAIGAEPLLPSRISYFDELEDVQARNLELVLWDMNGDAFLGEGWPRRAPDVSRFEVRVFEITFSHAPYDFCPWGSGIGFGCGEPATGALLYFFVDAIVPEPAPALLLGPVASGLTILRRRRLSRS